MRRGPCQKQAGDATRSAKIFPGMQASEVAEGRVRKLERTVVETEDFDARARAHGPDFAQSDSRGLGSTLQGGKRRGRNGSEDVIVVASGNHGFEQRALSRT